MITTHPKEAYTGRWAHLAKRRRPDAGRLLELLKMTEAEIAMELGVTQAAVNAWRRGKSGMRPEHWAKLIELLANRTLKRLVGRVTRRRPRTRRSQTGLAATPPELAEYVMVKAVDLALVLSERGLMQWTRKEWEEFFDLSPVVLRDVPTDGYRIESVNGKAARRHVITGVDVGLALEAAVRGETYSRWMGRWGGAREEVNLAQSSIGEQRLLNEATARWNWIERVMISLAEQGFDPVRGRPEDFELTLVPAD
jgi:transcriptional regulator with XRE-family HTH domain